MEWVTAITTQVESGADPSLLKIHANTCKMWQSCGGPYGEDTLTALDTLCAQLETLEVPPPEPES